jgi:hypothetical protein
MNPIVRRVIILGTPLLLGILDLFHPTFTPGEEFTVISAHLGWWITLHILQLPLFCLLALSAYLLLDGISGTVATLSKVALGIFVIFYPALDAILGLGTGALVHSAQGLGGFAQAIALVSITGYFSDHITGLVGAAGALGWAIGILLAVLALSRPTGPRWPAILAAICLALAVCYFQAVRTNLILQFVSVAWLARIVLLLAIALALSVRPRLASGLLVMAAFLFAEDHAPPFGPVAMACYFVAALQLEFFQEKALLVEQDVTPAKQNEQPVQQDVAPAENAAPVEGTATPDEHGAPIEQDVVPDPS